MINPQGFGGPGQESTASQARLRCVLPSGESRGKTYSIGVLDTGGFEKGNLRIEKLNSQDIRSKVRKISNSKAC